MRLPSSEPALIQAALDLGAGTIGGPLTRAEEHLTHQASEQTTDVEALTAAILDGADPLGNAFVALRSPATRRAVGAFYTPREIVEPMVAWAMSYQPTRLVDPGCGSGRFALAALRVAPDIEILAVDLDPLATLLTRANLAALGAQNARVLNANYLTAKLPAHDGPTAWVGNPPYVRHHDLTPAAKRWATKTSKRLGHKVSGLAGLHALFFLATAHHARPGDIGAFVTSAEWLDVGYGSVVRSLLLNGLGGRALDLIDPRAVPFADAMTTAVIASFVAGEAPTSIVVRLAAKPADLAQLGGGTAVTVDNFAATARWSPLFRVASRGDGELLGSMARVHRGTATGCNDFFSMTKADAKERGLTKWARPIISRANEVIVSDGTIRDAPERRVLIDLPTDLDRSLHPAADAFLRDGELRKIHKRYICSHRRPWWRLGLSDAPPIVASYMARQAPTFALNPDRLSLLNVVHGIYPLEGVDASKLVERLNTARASFVGSGRTYHGGLEKFEPREMEALVLP